MRQPFWLPELVVTDGEWNDVIGQLYTIFESDFKRGKPMFRGLSIWWEQRRQPGDPYEDGFWHLVARDDDATGDRLFDPPRAQRLRWCLAAINNSADNAVLQWEYEEGDGRVRTYLWMREFDYVVILERKTKHSKTTGQWFDIYDLITAFHVDGDSERRNLQRKYDHRLS